MLPSTVDPLSVHSLVSSWGIHARGLPFVQCALSSIFFPFAQEGPSQFHLTSKLSCNQRRSISLVSLMIRWHGQRTSHFGAWYPRGLGGCALPHPWSQKSNLNHDAHFAPWSHDQGKVINQFAPGPFDP